MSDSVPAAETRAQNGSRERARIRKIPPSRTLDALLSLRLAILVCAYDGYGDAYKCKHEKQQQHDSQKRIQNEDEKRQRHPRQKNAGTHEATVRQKRALQITRQEITRRNLITKRLTAATTNRDRARAGDMILSVLPTTQPRQTSMMCSMCCSHSVDSSRVVPASGFFPLSCTPPLHY